MFFFASVWIANLVALIFANCVCQSHGTASTVKAQLVKESDVYLGSSAFTDHEPDNIAIIFKWLDDIMWTDMWDNSENRKIAAEQLFQLADLSIEHLPSLAYSVGQSLYSYFWFKDNGGEMDVNVARLSLQMHELSLDHMGCHDLTMGIGTFIAKACAERWMFVIMISGEVGAELAKRRSDFGTASNLLKKSHDSFHIINQYPYFDFRGWNAPYDVNTNSHVFGREIMQRPLWPTEQIPIARWMEENYQIFKDDLEHIIANDLFDSLYFAGQVSMTQFSGKRESWAPLNLIHNRNISKTACSVANKTCELLMQRPEIARCHARDVGAAFARLHPGMGIKPHFWSAPPRLGVHLGLRTPPGAWMTVGTKSVEWKAGKSVVFDDTYIHTVHHGGVDTRYLLIAWFCHPCDTTLAEVPPVDMHGLCHR